MGKKYLVLMGLWAVLLYSNQLAAGIQQQTSKLDSLKSLLTQTKDSSEVDLLNKISWDYRNQNADSSLFYGTRAAEYARTIGYTDGLIQALNYMGIAHRNKSEYSIAFEFFVEALQAAESVNNLEQIGYSNINIGNIYIYQTNYRGAIEYFEKALEPAQELDDKGMIAYCYLNLGRTYARMKEFIRAEDYFLRTRYIREELGDFDGLVTSSVDLAQLFLLEGDMDKALKYFMLSLEDIKRVNNQGALVFSLNNISIIYRNKGDFAMAIDYAEQSLQIAREMGLKNDVRKAYENLSQIYELQGDHKTALNYFKSHIDKRDSIFNEEKTRTIENLKSEYDAEKKATEIRFQNTIKETRQKQIYTIFALSFGLVVIIAVIGYRSSIVKQRLNNKIRRQKDRVERDKILIEQQSKKLEELDFAKSRFFSNISHDLRSPLSIILGNHDQIEQDTENYLTSSSKKYLDIAQKNAKRLLFLTDEINELTKLEEGKLTLKPTLVKLHPYMTLLVEMFSSTAAFKGIDLTTSLDIDPDQTLQLDPIQFEKIIYNLVSNALKHSKKGDKVNVGVSFDEQKGVTIIIEDTGEGIPASSLPFIFDRYYQSPDNTFHVYEGLGIGLALVKELVELHGGEVDASSKVGEGTRFVMKFPVQDDINAMAIVPEKSDYITQKSSLWADLWEKTYQDDSKLDITFNKDESNTGKRILLVEDHPEVREYVRSLIDKTYQVLEAPDGMKALETLKKEHVDLVITDLMMPWMDGFTLLEEMRKEEKLKPIPVLVVSARNTENDKFRVLSQGVNDILQKPFSRDELLIRVSNMLERRNGWNNEKESSLLINDSNLMNDIERELLEKIEKLIIARVNDPDLSVLNLADEMAASERKVYRMIKKLTNLTPYEYIKEIRWQFLEKLINDKDVKNATEAANSIGMKNVTNFKKQFTKRFNRPIDEMIAKVE